MIPPEEGRIPAKMSRFGYENRFNPTLGIVALLWTLIIGGLGYWHYHQVSAGFLANARTAARYSIQKDMTYRRWATGHGGIYAPITDNTPPNPYLSHLPERDITTPSGRALTLVNPAYMTRQVYQLGRETFDSRGHITSLNPLRPENAPDNWERQALHAFADGAEERSSLVAEGDAAFLRLMFPFYVEQGCLRCHGSQGYEVGDLIGGISVAIDWTPYQQAMAAIWPGYAIGYGGIWLLGLGFIELHRRRLRAFLRYRKQSTLEQRALLTRLQKLGAHLPGMIYQYRLYPDGRSCVPYASQGIGVIFGVTPDQVKTDASRVMEMVHPDDTAAFKVAIQRSARDKSVWRNEFRVLHSAGHILWVEGYATPEELSDGSILWHGYIQDINDRKQSEQLLEQQQQMLKRRNAALEQFSYTVSHELRTPLVTAENLLGFVQQKLASYQDTTVDKHMGLIRDAARRMNQLLDSLMHMFRVESTPLDDSRVNAAALVKEVIGKLPTRLNNSETVTMQDNLEGCYLTGDPAHFTEIWQQLLDNAVTYSEQKTPPVIEAGVDLVDGQSVFYVRDNGCGIDPRFQERIFGLFDRLDTSNTGSGLGLALVKNIVELYGGRIWVDSAGIGQGSCFYFTLPAAADQDKKN